MCCKDSHKGTIASCDFLRIAWGAETSEREYFINHQKHKKILYFPLRLNWDLVHNLACFYRCRFRCFSKVQESLVLLQNVLRGDAHSVLTEHSLTAWWWNLPFDIQMHDWSQADLAAWPCKLGVCVCDRTLKLGCLHVIWDISVHIIDMDLIFSLFLC